MYPTLFGECRRPQQTWVHKTKHHHNGLLDDNRAVEPPESIPNSEVKRSIADGSVGSPHVRVGHRQASILNPSRATCWGFSLCATVCQVALLRFGVEYGESLLPDKGQADLLRPAGSAFPPSMAVIAHIWLTIFESTRRETGWAFQVLMSFLTGFNLTNNLSFSAVSLCPGWIIIFRSFP